MELGRKIANIVWIITFIIRSKINKIPIIPKITKCIFFNLINFVTIKTTIFIQIEIINY